MGKLKQHERVELESGAVRDVLDRDRQRHIAWLDRRNLRLAQSLQWLPIAAGRPSDALAEHLWRAGASKRHISRALPARAPLHRETKVWRVPLLLVWARGKAQAVERVDKAHGKLWFAVMSTWSATWSVA